MKINFNYRLLMLALIILINAGCATGMRIDTNAKLEEDELVSYCDVNKRLYLSNDNSNKYVNEIRVDLSKDGSINPIGYILFDYIGRNNAELKYDNSMVFYQSAHGKGGRSFFRLSDNNSIEIEFYNYRNGHSIKSGTRKLHYIYTVPFDVVTFPVQIIIWGFSVIFVPVC